MRIEEKCSKFWWSRSNPARVVKKRYGESEIDLFLKSEWWTIDVSAERNIIDFLYTKDVCEFVRRIDSIKNQLKSNST